MTLLHNIRGIEAKVGVVLCWYYDYEQIHQLALNGKEEDWDEVDVLQERLGEIIGCVPQICRREFVNIGGFVLNIVWDGLGSGSQALFGEDEELSKLYKDISAELTKRAKEKGGSV